VRKLLRQSHMAATDLELTGLLEWIGKLAQN